MPWCPGALVQESYLTNYEALDEDFFSSNLHQLVEQVHRVARAVGRGVTSWWGFYFSFMIAGASPEFPVAAAAAAPICCWPEYRTD